VIGSSHKVALVAGSGSVGLLGAVALFGLHPLAAGALAPVVTVTPGAPYSDGQTLTVSVGANTVFTPHAKVNILECADPAGTPANLPVDDSTCDGNTVQGNTLIVQNDGSFSEQSYVIYQLPSTTLGELANGQPVCNATQACVLYVGQDENDFSAPKVFSAPFFVIGTSAQTPAAATASGPSATGGPGTPGGSGSSANGAPPSANNGPYGVRGAGAASPASGSSSAAGASGTLAFTGTSTSLWVLGFGGLTLVGLGVTLQMLGVAAQRRKGRKVS